MVMPFKNEPLTDFSNSENKREMESALEKVQCELGREYPLIIGGERIHTAEQIVSINPCDTGQVIGRVAKANQQFAEKALRAAQDAFEQWKYVATAERAGYLFKAAAIMRRRKMEISAWMVLEAGKNWVEADADTAEAIDFLNFYAQLMLKYAKQVELVPLNGENNGQFYIPLGVGIIIPPWNFPNAIMCGTTVAPVVAGNTVILKPASATPVIAYKFMEIMEEAGLPEGVINYLPGSGGEIGDFLVGHPQTRFINFTGSMDVGLRINELAAKLAPGQKWIKRVSAEMGGKDAIIVDKDADLDAAAAGIVASAFGFQGQKCSACSRAIIVEDVYAQMLEKIAAKTKELKVGNTLGNPNMGAVIDETAFNKILKYIEIGSEEGRLLTGGAKIEAPGYFIEPTVFADVAPKARIAQEEIFGPVLAVIKAADFDEALAIANDTVYGLTGAVYSNNRKVLEKARRDFHVGNLYFNRKCTAALVGVHPFGGFNLSGTNSKAGGNDYLLLFMQSKAVSELL